MEYSKSVASHGDVGNAPEYSKSIPFHGDVNKALDFATVVLAKNSFIIQNKKGSALEMLGPGMRSNRQDPILGVSRIHISADRSQLIVDAELGGVDRMRRFLTYFPVSMALGFILLFGGVAGLIFGQLSGVGFGVPAAPGWWWLAMTVPISVFPLLPWLFLSPLMIRSIRKKTVLALDTLLNNMATV
jgi:hypothetical protein